MRSILLFLLVAATVAAKTQPYKLYGVTANGGVNGLGVLYSILSDGSGYQLLYSFGAGADGARPYGGLTIAPGSKLFGTTRAGGTMAKGTIFSYDTITNVYTKLADFTGANGASPSGDLTYYDGMLYGVAPLGGVGNGGTVFAYDPVAGVLSDLFNLTSATGTNPYGNITLLNGKLYFINSQSGGFNGGSIAVLDPVAGTVTNVYNFSALGYPHSGMVAFNNLLYGTEINRGEIGDIFSFDPATYTYTDVHDFNQASESTADVIYPNGLSVYNGVLYGSGQNSSLTGDGGGWFKFDPASSTFQQIYWGAPMAAGVTVGSWGWYPLAAPVALPDGSIAGTTPFGGDNYDGEIILSAATLTQFSFTGANGQSPMYGSLLVAADPAPLAIRILRFSGVLTELGRVLNWTASQPSGGGWFQLQRSTDETNYIPIDSMGAASGTASYTHTDDASLPGAKAAYYRLKMTDVNQVVSYSNIVVIGLDATGGDSLRLLNTVVSGQAFLQYTSVGAGSQLDVKVVSMRGVVWIQQELPVAAGVNSYTIDASALPAGMYVLYAAGRSIKFVKL
jgi:uncharacterized repeat protein (TIGR03803 family)